MHPIKIRSFTLQLILVISCFFKINVSYALPQNDICKIGKVVVGVVAVGGISSLIYNWYYNSDSYHNGVIDEGYSRFRSASKYFDFINTIENQYKVSINQLSEFQKRSVVDKINEEFLASLVVNFIKANIDIYLNDLINNINNLKSFQKDIQWSKQRLSTKNDKAHLLNKLNELTKLFDKAIPELEFLYSYVENHKNYIEVYKTFLKLYNYYQKELNLLYNNYDNYVVESLKKEICYRYYDKGIIYPYLRYVDLLNTDISKVKYCSSILNYGYKNLKEQINNFAINLELIKKHIVSDNDYMLQKEKFFHEEQIRQKNEFDKQMKQKELDLIEQKNKEIFYLKQREVAAREREANAREVEAQARKKEAEARQAEVIANQLKPQQPAAQVHVHIRSLPKEKNIDRPIYIPVVAMPEPCAPPAYG